jgi:hypothetical protein
MSTAVRPRINSSAALLVAGAVVAAPIVMPPVHHAAPALSTVAVRPASAITDTLNLFGDLVDFGFNAATAPVVAIDGLPEFVVGAVAVALQQPALAPSAFSALVQLAANPAYPGLAGYVLLTLEGVKNFLPPALGPSVTKDLMNSAATIGGLFKGLPDPAAGFAAMASFLNAPGPTQVLAAVTQVIPSVVAATRFVLSWVDHLPGTLEATVESAVRAPSQIPGLLSNLAAGVLGPTGVLVQVALNLEAPLLDLPAPIGGNTGLAVTFIQNAVHGVTNFVSHLLPTPVTPKPFAAVKPSAVPSGAAALTPKKISTVTPTASTPTATAASATGTGSAQVDKNHLQGKKADKHSSHAVTATAKPQDEHHK